MKILLVENNHTLAEGLRKHLGQSFVVDVVRTGEEGQRRALDGGQDIIILDLGLADKSGHEFCKSIRAANINTPILILISANDVASCASLLNAGADDYLTKPFSMAILRAHLGALLRRPPMTNSAGLLTLEDLVVDPRRRRVQRGSRVISLRRKEFDILEYLIRNRGCPVSRAMILDHAWDGTRDAWNNTVDVHIKHLRDKVDRPFKTSLIKTVYGIGYMIDGI